MTVMDPDGAPTPVAWTRMRAPQSLMAPTPDEVLEPGIAASSLMAKYGQAIDRDSAHEMLGAQAAGGRGGGRAGAAGEGGRGAAGGGGQEQAKEREQSWRRRRPSGTPGGPVGPSGAATSATA